MAGSFLQPDILWVSVCFPITRISASPSPTSLPPHHPHLCLPITRISASPSPTSLPPCHPHLCLPVTRISASPLPASRRCSLSILHELCDGHYVTSITTPPTSPEPINTCAQLPDGCPDPTRWQPGPEEGLLLPCLRLLHWCRASSVVTMRWGCGGPEILAASLLVPEPSVCVSAVGAGGRQLLSRAGGRSLPCSSSSAPPQGRQLEVINVAEMGGLSRLPGCREGVLGGMPGSPETPGLCRLQNGGWAGPGLTRGPLLVTLGLVTKGDGS